VSVNFVFLDSGTGGIPYMQCLKQVCPDARCVYLADAVHFPYGTKTPSEVTECASSAVALILEKWTPDAIVIACNTISVTSLGELRSLFPHVPIVGTVPAIKLAAKVSINRKIGLLATEGTVRHPYTLDLEKKYAADCSIVSRADTDLVSFIEHSLFTSDKEGRKKAVKPAVDFFAEAGCDTIVLGCTHFIHMAEDISEAAGNEVHVIDSREGVINQALKVASEQHSLKSRRSLSLFTTLTDFLKEKPSDQSLFVTGFRNPEDFSEYRLLCNELSIPWGGIVPL
jgi:glutamate racemase